MTRAWNSRSEVAGYAIECANPFAPGPRSGHRPYALLGRRDWLIQALGARARCDGVRSGVTVYALAFTSLRCPPKYLVADGCRKAFAPADGNHRLKQASAFVVSVVVDRRRNGHQALLVRAVRLSTRTQQQCKFTRVGIRPSGESVQSTAPTECSPNQRRWIGRGNGTGMTLGD